MTEPVNAASENLTYEKIMAMIHESRRESSEKHEQEMERLRKQSEERERQREENDLRIKNENELRKNEFDRLQKEADRRLKRTERLIGDLGNRFGEMDEHLVAPGIEKRFNELGFKFKRIIPEGMVLRDSENKLKTEVDIYLENHEYIIAVEVKAKPKEQDIEHHKRRLQIIREDREPGDQKKILGAIAGAVFPEDVKAAVLEAGMYVLEQSGDTMKIQAPNKSNIMEW